jgi:hypothetical protein
MLIGAFPESVPLIELSVLAAGRFRLRTGAAPATQDVHGTWQAISQSHLRFAAEAYRFDAIVGADGHLFATGLRAGDELLDRLVRTGVTLRHHRFPAPK